MNEAHVRTPAGFATVNRAEFALSFLRLPKRTKVIIMIGKRGKLLA
jgi:hypothetical protein